MILYLISWFAFSFSVLPPRLDVGLRHDIASTKEGAERIVNQDGVYLVRVSRIKNGRMKPVEFKLSVQGE